MTNSTNWAFALQLALKAGWTDEEISERLHELVTVADALAEVHTETVFENYLTSSNSFLNGARAVDVVRLGSYEEVLEAIEGHKAGAYA